MPISAGSRHTYVRRLVARDACSSAGTSASTPHAIRMTVTGRLARRVRRSNWMSKRLPGLHRGGSVRGV